MGPIKKIRRNIKLSVSFIVADDLTLVYTHFSGQDCTFLVLRINLLKIKMIIVN